MSAANGGVWEVSWGQSEAGAVAPEFCESMSLKKQNIKQTEHTHMHAHMHTNTHAHMQNTHTRARVRTHTVRAE